MLSTRSTIGVIALLVATTSCGGSSASGESVQPEADSGVALTDGGVALFGDEVADDAPTYRLTADIDPATGQVEGTVSASLPVGDAGVAHLRYFPALVDPGAAVTDVRVGDEPVDHTLDSSLLTVPLEGSDGDRVEVSAAFAYTVPEIPDTDAFSSLGQMFGDETLQPANIGLIGQKDGVLSLGHWFPIWVPEGLSAEPTPEGFGDIGNFPAAIIEASLEQPSGWTVVTGGTRQLEEDGRVVEAGSGLRDLAVVLVEDGQTSTGTSGGTTVRVTAPAGSTATEEIDEAVVETASSLDALGQAFGPYPWEELDVVATPLGSGVGGMEFPGVIWIESTIFSGGLPGLDDLDVGFGDLDAEDPEGLGFGDPEVDGFGQLFDALVAEEELAEIFDEDFGQVLADTFDALADGDAGGDLVDDLDDPDGSLLDELDLDGFDDLDLDAALDPDVLESTRAWVIAHEVGHQWWHAVVGNDSITAPIVDESLAQYSACLVFRDTRPETAEKVCDAQLAGTYEQMRAFGVGDAPADQPSDDFESTLQYSGVIYGKAPLFYDALADHHDEDAVVDALASVVTDYGFDEISSDQLRAVLSDELGDPATVENLWARWFEGTYGDEDILG